MMSKIVIRANVSCKDKNQYFLKRWETLRQSQIEGNHTDISFVVQNEEKGWTKVPFHKALILPLCPLLNQIVSGIIDYNETLVVIPDFSFELVTGFVRLIYEGVTDLSSCVTVDRLMCFMDSLGLSMPYHCLFIAKSEKSPPNETRRPKGLEILEIVDRNPVEIVEEKPQSCEDEMLHHKVLTHGNIGKYKKNKRVSLLMKRTKKIMPKDLENISITNVGVVPCASSRQSDETTYIPVEFQPRSKTELVDFCDVAKRKNDESFEVIGTEDHDCEICQYKCKYLKDLKKHYRLRHPDKIFSCIMCKFKTDNFSNLVHHRNTKHTGVFGVLQCGLCGFMANSNNKMTRHKKKSHSHQFSNSKPRNELSIPIRDDGKTEECLDDAHEMSPVSIEMNLEKTRECDQNKPYEADDNRDSQTVVQKLTWKALKRSKMKQNNSEVSLVACTSDGFCEDSSENEDDLNIGENNSGVGVSDCDGLKAPDTNIDHQTMSTDLNRNQDSMPVLKE